MKKTTKAKLEKIVRTRDFSEKAAETVRKLIDNKIMLRTYVSIFGWTHATRNPPAIAYNLLRLDNDPAMTHTSIAVFNNVWDY